MAKHGKGRRSRRSRIQWIRVNLGFTLSTLADDTILDQLIAQMGREAYLVVAKGLWSLREGTAGEGPIMVGFAHSDYTVTEIEECLDSQTSFAPDDLIAVEQRKRKVRQAGAFPVMAADEVLADGQDITTPLRFVIGDAGGDGLALWAYNQSGAALTTGALIRFTGVIGLRWL